MHRMEDQQVKFTIVSSEKSLVDIMMLIKQYDGVLPTMEVIKLAKVCIAVIYFVNLIFIKMMFSSYVFM